MPLSSDEGITFTSKQWGRTVRFKYLDSYLDWRKQNGADWTDSVRGQEFTSTISASGTVYIQATGCDADWNPQIFEYLGDA